MWIISTRLMCDLCEVSLECDNYNEQKKGRLIEDARSDGWLICRGEHICSDCRSEQEKES